MNVYITRFKPHKPYYVIEQSEALDWLAHYHKENIDSRSFLKYAINRNYIKSRAVYAPGIAGANTERETLFHFDESRNPTISTRGKIAQQVLDDIFADLYLSSKENVTNHIATNLCHVSCTHYQSPSSAQKLVVQKERHAKTKVTHLYHMGCYAAFPAIRVARGLTQSKALEYDVSKSENDLPLTDIVHTELCSFHLNKEQITASEIIMKTLFADGAIRYALCSQSVFKSLREPGLEMLTHHEVIVPKSEKEMSWIIGEHGFVMTLTKSVPVFLKNGITNFMQEMFEQCSMSFEKEKENTLFAIHPGGPKIIEFIQSVLKLNDEQVAHSKFILETRGNMSSATVPHIWHNMLEDKSLEDGNLIASVAFGPGLTMTGSIFRLCRP